jgi:hypothetical protein
MWLFQAWQSFLVILFAFALIGFMRGWRREIVSLAFTLAAVLIVDLGGGSFVAEALFVRLPLALQDPNNLHPPGPPSALETEIVTGLTLVVIIALGYIVGNKAFPKPKVPVERFLGAIPAIIAGIAVYEAISRLASHFNKSPAFTFAVPNPGPDTIGNYLLLIFVVLIVLVIIGLMNSRSKKRGGATPKGH